MPPPLSRPDIRLGVDIGGTFTDVAMEVGRDLFSIKLLTDHANPEQAILEAVAAVCRTAGIGFADIGLVIHGTTLAANARIVHVIGTTGMGEAEETAVKAAARHATIVKAGNMSLGVNLLVAVTRKVAEALDADFDIEVLEMHHKHKVDAPSGTALMLGRAAAEGRKVDLDKTSVRVRDGHTGARRKGDIGFATLRGGNVVGEHTVIFSGENERVEITHRATDRGIFARGAVKAALWARGKGPGLFSMADVLGL